MPARQRHPDPDRQIRTLALVRAAARLGGPRPHAHERRDQHHGGHGGGGHRRAEIRQDGAGRRARCLARLRPEQPGGRGHRRLRLGAYRDPAAGARQHRSAVSGPGPAERRLVRARPALFTAFVSGLAYNFFFLAPLYNFTIADPNNFLSFAVLLLVAVTAGNLGARVRAQANLASARAAVASELFRFTGKLAAIARWTTSCGPAPIRYRPC
ncbi:MAG: DUF4118 domain-containing protein [Rhizomicrobium sp.]